MSTIAIESRRPFPRSSLVPWSDETLTQSVAAGFDRALRSHSRAARERLRTATIALGHSMSNVGLPPEYALIMLKQQLRGHGRPGWAPSLDFVAADNQVESRLYAKVFAWWIRAFFNASDRPEPAQRSGPG